MDHPPIACAIVDNLEVACLYHYVLSLHLPDGPLEGQALDLTQNELGEECLRLKGVKEIRDVPLKRILKIDAKTQNPYFSTLNINASQVCQ